MEALKTPLFDKHKALGARMVSFGGWDMPVQYSEGIIAEHVHTRTKVSLFDICHMGEIRIKGEGASDAMDRIFPRAVAAQKVGVCRYNFLLTEKGTVIDDLIIYKMDEDELFVVVNAATKDGDLAELKELLPDTLEISDESDATAKLDLQGPLSADVLAGLGIPKEELPGYYKWIKTEIGGVPMLLSRTGYTGELGFELYFDAKFAEKIWDLLLEQPDVKPAGLGARDTLRLEMGYPLYGHEMDTETTPLEAGFGGMIKLDSGRNFRGADALRNIPPAKKLVGIVLDGRRAAREGAEITIDGKVVGKVTSGAFSPTLGKAVAMGYLDAAVSVEEGAELELAAGRSVIPGKITSMPFCKETSLRASVS